MALGNAQADVFPLPLGIHIDIYIYIFLTMLLNIFMEITNMCVHKYYSSVKGFNFYVCTACVVLWQLTISRHLIERD